MKKKLTVALLAVLMITALVACGGGGDKTVKASTTPDAYGSSRELVLTLDGNGKVKEAVWKELINGKEKDSSYASDLSESDYEEAQDALTKVKNYPIQLVETKDIEKVEVIAGATESHDDFVKLYHEAMKQAN